MEVKQSTQYYLYNNENHDDDFIMVEENKLLKQLQEAVLSSKDNHSEDELSAAVGMMLMHYQAVVKEPEYPSENKFDAQIQEEEQEQLKPELTITKVHDTATTQNIPIDSMKHQVRKNRKNNYNKSSLLASCRNILKEFLSQNGL